MNYPNGREIKHGDLVLATDYYGYPKIGKVTRIFQSHPPAAKAQVLVINTPDEAIHREIRVAAQDCYPIDEALELLEEKYRPSTASSDGSGVCPCLN